MDARVGTGCPGLNCSSLIGTSCGSGRAHCTRRSRDTSGVILPLILVAYGSTTPGFLAAGAVPSTPGAALSSSAGTDERCPRCQPSPASSSPNSNWERATPPHGATPAPIGSEFEPRIATGIDTTISTTIAPTASTTIATAIARKTIETDRHT